MFEKLKSAYRRLVAWQQRPIAPPALSEAESVCRNCGQTFNGNYCPRCGQDAATRRLTLRNMLRTLLDTWGLGTHSLLRTLGHLLARPGYMIGDYLDGRRQPYFPPFKTLLIVGTAYALVVGVTNFYGKTVEREEINLVSISDSVDAAMEKDTAALPKLTQHEQWEQEQVEKQFKADLQTINNLTRQYQMWREDHMVMDQLLMHFFFALFAWRLFRRAPRRPGLNFSEQFIAQVYICAQMGFIVTLYMLARLLSGATVTGFIPNWLWFLLFVYDYKQLFGYGLLRTVWKTILSEAGLILISIFALCAGFFVLGVRAMLASQGM